MHLGHDYVQPPAAGEVGQAHAVGEVHGVVNDVLCPVALPGVGGLLEPRQAVRAFGPGEYHLGQAVAVHVGRGHHRVGGPVREDVLVPGVAEDVLGRLEPSPADDHVEPPVARQVRDGQALAGRAGKRSLGPGVRRRSLPQDDAAAVGPLLARDDLARTVGVEVAHADVVGAWGADDVPPPRVHSRVAFRQGVLVPLQAVVRVPLGDQEVRVAVAAHVHQPGVAAPLARLGDDVPPPRRGLVPDQRPVVAAGGDDVGNAVSGDVPGRLYVGVPRALGVNYLVHEHRFGIAVHAPCPFSGTAFPSRPYHVKRSLRDARHNTPYSPCPPAVQGERAGSGPLVRRRP